MWAKHTIAIGAILILASGCATQQREREYRQHQLEVERDNLRAALDDEKAKTAALGEERAAESRGRQLAEAESATLRQRLESAAQRNIEFQRLIEERARRELVRPEVPVSPLPGEVDEALLTYAQRHAGRVWYQRERGAVSFASDRFFESGSDRVGTEAQAVLGELAGIAALTKADEFEIIVVGHTDSSPIVTPETLQAHASNWHLSVHRAIAVKNVLVSAGLPESRMGVMGYGPHRPVSDDKARNRRVEVFFVRRGDVGPLTTGQPVSLQPRRNY